MIFQMFPHPMCSFPPEYYGGLGAAIGVMHRSNILGKHEAKLKVSSAGKAHSAQYNMSMVISLGGTTAQSIRSDKGHQSLTTAPTGNEWFGSFFTGLWVRVGDRRRQYAAI